MVLEFEMPARPGQAFEGGLVCLRRPRPWALPQRAGLPPGAGAPLLLPGGVCRIVDFPYWLKGKVYVRLPCTPGAQKKKGGGKVGLRQDLSSRSPAGVNGLTSAKSKSMYNAPHPKLFD